MPKMSVKYLMAKLYLCAAENPSVGFIPRKSHRFEEPFGPQSI